MLTFVAAKIVSVEVGPIEMTVVAHAAIHLVTAIPADFAVPASKTKRPLQ